MDAGEGRGASPGGLRVLPLILITALVTYGATSFYYRWKAGAGPTLPPGTEELAGSPAFKRLITTLQLIQKEYVEEVNVEKTLEGAIEGAVSSLGDPYSAYYPEQEFRHFQMESRGAYGGIGVEVTDEGKYTVVVSVFPGTPGATTPFEGAAPGEPPGLRPRDRILKVDDRDVVGMKLADVVRMIRGPVGTPVRLRVLRGERELSFRFTRAEIRIPTVDKKVLPEKVGYLRISHFTDETPGAARQALRELKEAGITALVLDLRSNPGGRLDSAVEVARLFVPRGPIVSVVKRNGEKEVHSSFSPRGWEKPLLVLVDEGTASAAEILAGAIRDRGVGKLLGTHTFGKASVQEVWELGEGTGLKLTVAKYYTPKGVDISRKGLEPDYPFTVPEGTRVHPGDPQEDPALRRALEVLSSEEMARPRAPEAGVGSR